MHTYTESQIKDCETLFKLIEQKTGVKREPKVGEVWYTKRRDWVLILTWGSNDMFYHADVLCLSSLVGYEYKKNTFLHPLYSHGELLEMIKDKYQKQLLDWKLPSKPLDTREKAIRAIFSKGDILSALLKLAIEVQEGK